MKKDQIRKLPKCEFHLHLEGAVPYSLLRERYPEKYAKTPASWAPDFRFEDFDHFERELLVYAGDWFGTPEDYHRAAAVIFADLLESNVRYLETSIASGCVEFGRMDLAEVAAAVKNAVPPGLEVRLFLGIHHDGYTGYMAPMIEKSLTDDLLDGYDLHGTETVPLEPWTADIWKRAESSGKFIKAHAGEFDGPGFIRKVINELGVRRLEHGIRAVEDPALVRELAGKNIVLDVCPWSNLKLGVVSSFAEHPLRGLTDAGVKCTINRDDPVSFGTTLTDEYEAVMKEMNFTDEEVISLIRNGFETALVSETKKEIWLDELNNAAKNI